MKPGKKTRIVIGGGGFAGLYAAKQLDETLGLEARSNSSSFPTALPSIYNPKLN